MSDFTHGLLERWHNAREELRAAESSGDPYEAAVAGAMVDDLRRTALLHSVTLPE